jgi:hypothetical protein
VAFRAIADRIPRMKTLKLIPAFVCFLIGGIGCLSALGAAGPPGALFGRTIVALAFCIAGFLLFLRWRDRYAPPKPPRWSVFYKVSLARQARYREEAGIAREAPPARFIDVLEPGAIYRVIKAFTDFYGDHFEVGTELTFIKMTFVPYHGGTTVHFHPRNIYLQDEASSELINRLEAYLERMESAHTPGLEPPPLPSRR